ncbi:hypothetical protein WR25_06679 [Diploscapter pachys]|uniref:Uncharacterized protein n=1 Tax=Diploscapter pachys TaxID=2018661 RepID=A0A2A2K0G6_9BILA|nr:hypothetical protein WR25_06679 [Diploscapter pachys]
MSQTQQPLNLAALQAFVQSDASAEPDNIHHWYQKLSEYDLEGAESPADIQLIHEATKYLMNFYFTAAEEQKRIAEKEAIECAEKEEAWEEQRQILKEELDELRERITTRADVGGSSEAFRAQIDSLKEENRQLQQATRDRDREMADQRDRFESLAARVEMLTRERDSLAEHRVQLEDAIRQLNRRLSSKTEDQSSEWETRKLRIRNEQAIALSKQMQVVVTQNDELRSEVSRVSDALEEATQLIENSAHKYAELLKSYDDAKDMLRELTEENDKLTAAIQSYAANEGEAADRQADSANRMQKLVNNQMAEIRELQNELTSANTEVAALQAMIREDRSAEKEAELEKLKDELVKATKTARTLFGEAMAASSQGASSSDPTVQLQMRILQLEHNAQQLRDTMDQKQKEARKLEETLEEKENLHAELAAELENLKERKFGDARSEINRLETQLKFRDKQIAKLTNHCTMLQVELGRYAEFGVNQGVHKAEKITDEGRKEQITSETKKTDQTTKIVDEKKKTIIEEEEGEEAVEIENKQSEKGIQKRKKQVAVYGTVAEQSLLIASLYSEIMSLLEELTAKDKQLNEMGRVENESKKKFDEMKTELKMAYEQIGSLEKLKVEMPEKMLDEMQKIEDSEVKRLVDSIRIGGTELERRMAEVTRKFISERVQRIRLSRKAALLQKKCERMEAMGKKAIEAKNHIKMQSGKQLARLQYQLDMSLIDLARLQTSVINSVHLTKYEALLAKYKNVVASDSGIEMTIGEEIASRQNIELSDKLEEKTAEWIAKEKMLKKINEVLIDQNEFWSKEVEILQSENEELKKFIEDIENESDLKSVMGAIESRLLDTIRELQENLAVQRKEKRSKQDAEKDKMAAKQQSRQTQKRLFSAIHILQTENTALRTQQLGRVTLQQVEAFKKKIIEARQKEIELEKKSKIIEDIEEKSRNEERRRQIEHDVKDLIAHGEVHQLQTRLQNAMQNASLMSAKCNNLEKMVKSKEQQLTDLKDDLEELTKWNEEKAVLIESLKNWSVDFEEEDKPNVKNEFIKPEKMEPQESDYEMDMQSETSDESVQRERVVVKTIVRDNSRQFEMRIAQMKDAAEAALRGYKEQLAQRDAAIETYKELLLSKINEEPSIEKSPGKQRKEQRNTLDSETEKALRDAISEINRLNIELNELEDANRNLAKDRRRVVPMVHVSVQTNQELSEIREESESSRSEDEVDRTSHSTSRQQEQRMISALDLRESEEITRQMEDARQTERYKMEIRTLKARLQRLTQTNKDLLMTCEKIREDALQELEAKHSDTNAVNERRNAELKVELDKLRRRNGQLRKGNDELNKEISELRQELSGYEKDKKIDTAEWHRRKKLEESLDLMKKRLEKAVEKEQLASEALTKKEKRLEDIAREQENRQIEMERINRKLRIITKERDEALQSVETIKSTIGRSQIIEEKLQKREKDLFSQQQTVRRLQSELTSIREEKDHLKRKLEEERKMKREMAVRGRSAKVEHRAAQTEEETRRIVPRDRGRGQTSVATQAMINGESTRRGMDNVKSTTSTMREEIVAVREENNDKLKEALHSTEQRLFEATRKVKVIESNYSALETRYQELAATKTRIEDESRQLGAVTILADKLEAKDKEIIRLKRHINELENKLSE